MQNRPPRPKRRLLLRQLEERLLFTAVPFVVPEIDPDALGADHSGGGPDAQEAITSPLLDNDVHADTDGVIDDALRREVVIVDSAVEGYETLLEDLAGDGVSRQFDILVLDSGQDAIEQITSYLSGKSDLDAIHVISHGDDATLRLGDLRLTADNLDGYAGSIASWGGALARDADLLLYGCDVASTEDGQALATSLSVLTGADVAASDDLTGHDSLGGDWVLEYATGVIETAIAPSDFAQSAYLHVLADAVPNVTVSMTGGTQPGSDAVINLSFDNAGLPGDTGFGPFIDVLIPKLGADGIYDGDTAGDGSLYDLSDVAPADGQPDGEPDGLILPAGLTVSYQGLTLNSFLYTFGDDDGVGPGTTGTIAHPYAVDAAGNPLDVVGQAGDQLLVIELPFGSFATDQPAVDLTINAPISPLADIGTPLTVFARGGFRYGNDALDNPATDPSLLSDAGSDATTWSASDAVTPSSLVVNKTTTAAGEGATGPNWLQTYTITVDIPTGQVLNSFVLSDALPDNIQFSQITGVSVGGAANTGVNFTTNVNDTDAVLNYYGQNEIAGGAGVTYDAALVGTYGAVDPSGPQAADTLAIVADSGITGYDGTDITVTVTYFTPEKDAAGNWVIGGNAANADKGEDDPNSPEVTNTATVTGSMAAADARDTGGAVNENDTATLDVKSIALQKSVSVVGGGGAAPGKLLQWTLSFELSDYYTYGNLVIDDLFSDGQIYFSDPTYKANFSVTDRGATRSGDFAFTYGSVGAAFDGTNTFVVDESRRDSTDNAAEVEDPTSDGNTEIKVFLSEALKALGDDGILEGDLADNGTFDGQSATGTITFYTQIQEDFVDPLATEDRSVDQGDTLTNSATLTADNHVNRNLNALMPASGHTESDAAAASTSIAVGSLTKQLYAINGDTSLGGDLNIAPGDRVTYRLTYSLPTTDFENLVLTDFFPLPVFDVADPDADGYSPIDPNNAWVFDADTSTTNMGSGIVELMTTDTFYDIWDMADGGGLDDSAAPTISVDTSSNSLSIDFGSYDGATNGPTQIDVLVTVAVGDTEFADGMFLTNMALASEAATGGTPASNVDLIPIELSAPQLEITKGIVSTSIDATAVYSTTAIANELQEISGAAGGPFTITFEGETTAAISATASVYEVRSALEALSNVEAGDVIVSGNSIGSGTMRVAFIGQYEATDINFSVSDPGLTATQVLAGGSAITESSRAAVWGLPGATANTASIDAATIAAMPIDGDVSGLDGRDQVKYAVTLRNVGGADAYDISLTDLLPAGLEVAAGGLNLRVYNGDGSELTWTALGPDPLVDGIRVNDPIAVYAWADDGFDRLVKMDSRDNFDNTSNANFVGPGGGVTSIEAMALDPTDGTIYAIDQTHLGTIDPISGTFTPAAERIDADLAVVIEDVDALSFHPVTGELWGVDAIGNELIKIDKTTGKAIAGAWGGADYLTVPGGKLDDIAIDFAGIVFASAGNQLETLTIDETAGTVTRNVVGTFDYGATTLDDMEGISVDQRGRLWGTTGNNDTSIYDDRLWEIDKATGDVSNPRELAVGGDFESVVAFDPNASGSAIDSGNERDTLIITYDAQVADAGTVNTTYENTASLNNYSGTDDGANFVTTPLSDTAQINTIDLSLDTFIDDTSEAHTGVGVGGETEGAIGEIIRYRVELVLPEGTLSDVTLQEQLPTGLTFLNDGTASIAFVSDSNAITSTDISDAIAYVAGNETSIATIDPAGSFGNEDIADSINGIGDVYATGSDVFFRLGDVVNTDDDANTEYIVLEFNALVDNSAGSNAGDVLTHTSQLHIADAPYVATTPTADDQVLTVEPSLSVTSRTFSMAQVDAGDVFTVTVTIAAAGGANNTDAFDLDFIENIPTGFTRTGAVTVSGGAYTPSVIDNSTATKVDLDIDKLPKGDTVTVTYQVTANNDLAPAGTHGFGGDLTWTSVPGASGTVGAPDMTGSDPPGAPSDPTGERTGDNATYAQNDYKVTGSTNLAGRSLGFTKTLVGTEIANDIDANAFDDQAVVGEKVTYRLRIDVPEGRANNLSVTDTLDPGLAFVGITSVTAEEDLAHFGGAPITIASITTTPGAGGQSVTFDIGDVLDPTPVNTNDLDAIIIEYEAIVLNVAGNQGGPSESKTALNNSATLSYTGGSNITRNAANIEVIEPELTTTLDVYGSGGSGDTLIEAGETITAVYTISNTSGVDAFDVYSFLDLIRVDDGSTGIQNSVTPGLAPAFTVVDTLGIYDATDFEWVDPDLTTNPGSDAEGWRLQIINADGFDISGADPARTITITVNGTASDTVDAGETYATSSGASFTSINGAAVDRSAYNTDSDERSFDPTMTIPHDDYQSTNSSNITMSEPSITKSLTTTEVNATGNDHTQATIGELVTYTVEVTLPQGITNNLVVNDALDPGLAYVGMVSGSAPTTVGADGKTLTWNLGNQTNDPANGTDNTITLVYQAVVVDVSANSAGTQIGESTASKATLDFTLPDASPGTQKSDDTTDQVVTIVEPVLTATSSMTTSVGGDQVAEAGETVTYTLVVENTGTVAAYDADIFLGLPFFKDDLAVEKPLLQNVSFTVVDSNLTYNDSGDEVTPGAFFDLVPAGASGLRLAAANTANIDLDAIPGRTITVTVTGTVIDEVAASDQYRSWHRVDWTSMDGLADADRSIHNNDVTEPAQEREFDPAWAPDTYRSTQSEYLSTPAPVLNKTLTTTEINGTGNDHTQAAIGELITYTLTVDLPQGVTHNVSIADVIDPGLALHDVVSTSHAPTASTLTANNVSWDFGDVTNDPANGTDNQLTIVYRAVVIDTAANQEGTMLGEAIADKATLTWDDDGVDNNDWNAAAGLNSFSTSDDTTDQVVTVVEPTVTITRDAYTNNTPGITEGDAGDPVKFVMVLSNTSGVDAFDLELANVLPTVIGGSSSAITSPTFTVNDTLGTYTAADFELVGSNATGWTFQKKAVTDLDLVSSAARTITIEIDGTLANVVPGGSTITDDAQVTWTSLDGDFSVARNAYSTASVERDGSDTEVGLPDDYERSRADSVTVRTIDPTKTVIGTSLASSGSGQHNVANPDLAIGEEITYSLSYTFSEGLTRSARLIDLAGTGTKLDILNVVVVGVGTNLYDAGADLESTADDTALNVAGVQAAVSITDSNIDTYNDTVTINLSNVQNAADGVLDAQDVITIEVTARAADDVANVNGAVLTNKAQFKFLDADSGFTTDTTLESATVSADVVTHDLSLSKNIVATKADAGEQVTIVLTVQNTGTADAHQVDLRDTLASAAYDLNSVVLGVAGTDYPTGFSANMNTVSGELTYTGGTIAAGATETFTFLVDVADGATPGDTHTNLATVTDSSSLDAAHANQAEARTQGDTDAIDNSALDGSDSFDVRENKISGFVYVDADMSGAMNGAEVGIANVTMTLSGTDHLGNAITPIVINTADGLGVDPLGFYEFDGLRPGTYTLTQTQPATHLDHDETVGTAGTLAGVAPVHDVITYSLPTGSETDSTGNNFGELTKSEIVGYVHRDSNLDGNYDAAGGIANVSVTIDYTDDRTVGGSQTVTTDGSGRFVFADLRPGTYTITVDSADPDLSAYTNGIERDNHNATDSTTDYQIGSFTLAQGESEDDKWFGFHQDASISGHVYHDEDNDAVKDVAEVGIGSVQVRLTGLTFEGDAITPQTVFTNAAGYYEFTDLAPGTYAVQELVDPLGYIDGRNTAGDPAANTTTPDVIANIVLSDGESSTGNLFGELVPSKLSGVVFNDFDGSGAQNGGETGIEGVTVTLTGTHELPDGSSAAIIPVAIVTDVDGKYSFTGLRPGTYTITETHPTEYADGADTAGTLGGNTTVNEVISAIVVSSADDGTGYTFAETGASITGKVYRDDDRDGMLDIGEPGIMGVTIELYESDGTTLITNTTTDASGNYSFDNLPAADYVVKEIQPTGHSSSPAADTNTRNITLVTGVDNTGNHFGEALWDLNGRVWFDRDAGADNDVGEHGFDAVTVTLLYAGADGDLGTAGDNVTFVTTTDANGDYSFTELLNGNYRVTIDTMDLPDAVTNNVDPDGGTASQSEFTISGADISSHDFGYLGAGVISDQLWLDVDGDGIYESATEPGLANVTVNILFAGDDGLFGGTDDMAWTDVTDAAGNYDFSNLPDGNYRVNVDLADTDLPAGIAEVTVGNSKSGTVNITLDAVDRVADDTDFGFVGQRTIGDQLWFDMNGDGVKDAGEPGLGGVTVQLSRSGPNGAFTVTTTTAADGSYSFDKLPEGNYVVTATAGLPADAVATHDVDGTNDGTANFSIGAADRTDIDFGYRGSGVDGATISDRVWYDHNGDGIQDLGEPGISGATVTLLFAGADGVFGNADDFTLNDTTDLDGVYGFTNLFVGDYRISVSNLPSSMTQTYHKDDGVGSLPEVSEINMPADFDRGDIDFGYTGTRTASGQVWIDRNANDTSGEANEPGIGGVTVDLLFSGADGIFGNADDMVLTTTTDAAGNYSFGSLADGDYRVTSSANLPAGTSPTSGGGVIPDGIVDFTISGADVTGQDLGHVGTRTIGDRVWYDIDGDGNQDAGEPGLENVDLTIVYFGADGNQATALDNLTFNLTTGVNGAWSIDGLADGDYAITLDAADLPTNLDVITLETDDFAAAADNIAHVRIQAPDPAVRNNIDFGFTGDQTIGSKVWLDLDADGNVDAGEPGLGGVDVTVVWGGFDNNLATAGDNVTYTTVTDSDGNYSIDRLPDGNFTVSIDVADLPTGMTPTFEVDGTTNNDAAVTLTGTGNAGVNFGYRGSASVGDLVYLDGEADGLQTGQDRGLTDIGVTLTYLGTDGTANGDASEFQLLTTSGALGSFGFDFLPGGTYTIAVDTLDGDLPSDVVTLNNGTGNAIGADETFALINGGTNTNLDFVFAGTRTIGDRVFYDRNDNTADDAGESGIVGVDLTLTYAGQDGVFGTVDDMTFNATTGAAGAYSFANAAGGDYRLSVATASLPDAMRSTYEVNDGADTLADTAEFTVSGANRSDIDFGYTGDGVVSDRIWVDVNGDGIQDAGEPGLAGVTVTLLFAGDDGIFGNADDFTFTTDTDASGLYSFTKLPDGAYRVTPDTADIPGSTTPTHDVDGVNDGVANITLAGSPSRSDVDFGFRGTRTVQGQVWLDRNSNDINGETNEPGLGGVTVELTFAGKDGDFATAGDNFVVTTVTDANGDYQFDLLPDGDYRVTGIGGLPVGVTPTSGGGVVPDGIVDFTVAGANPANQNLGYIGSSTISDLIWLDHDGDGTQNAGTVGLADVGVTLVYTGSDGIVNGDTEEFTLSVDSEDLLGTLGRYVFDNLPAGTFAVSIDTADVDLPSGLVPFASAESFNTSTNVTVATGAANSTTDFGLRGTRDASGVVFFDGDANGVQAATNEDGFVGVTMSLLAAGQDGVFGTGDDFTLSVDTAGGGAYSFSNLIDGNYRVSVDTADVPGAESQTYDIDATLDDRGDFALAGSRNDVDFGYRGNSTISDRVWYDLDGNGAQDVGEVGIPNQTVEAIFAGTDGLFGTADDLTFTDVTDASGLYSFNNLIDGDYRVSVPSPPAGMSNTAAPDDGVGSVADTAEVSLSASTIRNDVDLGFTGTGDFGGTVWFDYDGDGINDADEPGLPGVDVQLEIDIDGDGLVDQTLTRTVANDGSYNWTNLPAGSFTVTVLTPPSGSAPTHDSDGTLTPHTADFNVPAGGSAPDQSFGYTGTGAISGDVIYDVNDNGVEDAGDRGQGGADVTLEIDLDGDTVADLTRTVASNALDGSYSFTNLIAGTYTVTVDPATLPDSLGNKPTFDADGHVASPHELSVAVPAATSVVDQDFGYHGSPDLSVTITDNVASVGTGQAVTYTIDIENLGTSRASGSQLTVSLPTSVLENLASTDPGAIVNIPAGTVTFNIGDIAEGATLTKTITAKVLDAVAAGIDDVDVDAVITDDGSHGADDVPANNSATDTDIVVAVPDLRTEITAVPPVVTPGDTITYTVTMHNDGDQGATGVQAKTQIDVSIIDPATVTFEDSLGNPIPPADITFNTLTGGITWDAGGVVSGGAATIVIKGDVFDPVSTLKTSFEIDVIACNDGLNGEDPTDANDGPLDNNHQEAFTTLDATPEYFVDIEIDAPADHTFQPRDTVTFDITAGNIGNQNGDNVEVITQLPMTLIDPATVVISDPAATFDPGTGEITWLMGSVTGGGLDVRTITVMATIPIVTGDPLADRIEFSSLVYDDGMNGPDLVVPNNNDLDGRELLQYAFDSNNSFLQQPGFESGVDWYGYRDEPLRHTKPLPIDPIYSGLAEPGTTLLLKMYDDEGHEIGSRMVMADTGGNWVASFPGAVIWENPHGMTVETIGALNTLGEESQYNTRRYFQPALHPSMFFAPRPTVQSVVQEMPSRVMAAIHDANLRPLQFGTSSHSYQMNVASNSTAAR